MPAGMYLVPRDMMALEGYSSYEYALKFYHTLVDSLGKTKGKRITIAEYAKLQEVSEAEVTAAIEKSQIPNHRIRNNRLKNVGA